MRKCLPFSAMLLCMSAFAAYGQAPAGATFQKDVVYGHAEGVDLKLDLGKPPAGGPPVPALVFIHGGAWQVGSKDTFEPLVRQFADNGYVTASVEYRLAPAHKWPAQIEDVKCAVRYLRAHAKELNIIPDKIGAAGDSAGGHLSLLLGLMDPKDGLEGTGGNPEQSSKVQAVVNFYGPTDMKPRPLPCRVLERGLRLCWWIFWERLTVMRLSWFRCHP
jgi:acetyl esterase/lipase